MSKDVENKAKTKGKIVAAIDEAFAYCDAAYAKMTEASAAKVTTFFGMKITRLGVMDYNIAHTMEPTETW